MLVLNLYNNTQIMQKTIAGIDLVDFGGELRRIEVDVGWGVSLNQQPVQYTQAASVVVAGFMEIVNRPTSYEEVFTTSSAVYDDAVWLDGARHFKPFAPAGELAANKRYTVMETITSRPASVMKRFIYRVGKGSGQHSWLFFCDNIADPEYGLRKLEDAIERDERLKPFDELILGSFNQLYASRTKNENSRAGTNPITPVAVKRHIQPVTNSVGSTEDGETPAPASPLAEPVLEEVEKIRAEVIDEIDTAAVEQPKSESVSRPRINLVLAEQSRETYGEEVAKRIRARVTEDRYKYGWLLHPQTPAMARIVVDMLQQHPKRRMSTDQLAVLIAEKIGRPVEDMGELKQEVAAGITTLVERVKMNPHPLGDHIVLNRGSLYWRAYKPTA